MEIVFSTEKEHLEFLDKGLDKFNHAYIPVKQLKDFGFFCKDGDRIIGGVNGVLNVGYWAKIDMFYVDDEFRGRDIGTRLMNEVEKFARQNLCIGIYLSTWDWQAKGFYEKMGFSVFGVLNNSPKVGSTKYEMKKEFAINRLP